MNLGAEQKNGLPVRSWVQVDLWSGSSFSDEHTAALWTCLWGGLRRAPPLHKASLWPGRMLNDAIYSNVIERRRKIKSCAFIWIRTNPEWHLSSAEARPLACVERRTTNQEADGRYAEDFIFLYLLRSLVVLEGGFCDFYSELGLFKWGWPDLMCRNSSWTAETTQTVVTPSVEDENLLKSQILEPHIKHSGLMFLLSSVLLVSLLLSPVLRLNLIYLWTWGSDLLGRCLSMTQIIDLLMDVLGFTAACFSVISQSMNIINKKAKGLHRVTMKATIQQ